ncbi:cobyrinic acid a,c-diamide synthase [Halomonas sp. I1]|uniref:cobyrinic acid a,c-diamide synthase n=1 Tax=Halomonas sp. I1 TaxID=393536 RepID=UPI0028DDB3B4|nr:cobyrinic acid a,c-diamide synthase [Halomonas sp. I1]MDT8895593.1 cobyrinic acid a,c-diamide synthase [Halomonas sp. I1]
MMNRIWQHITEAVGEPPCNAGWLSGARHRIMKGPDEQQRRIDDTMLEFLQGAAYGLFLTCPPWCLIGLVKPRLALPTESPQRWHVLVRYGAVLPFISFLMWLTSLWGGFGPSLWGWLAGLVAIAVELPLERRWRRWRSRRRQHRHEVALRRERARSESGVVELDPTRPPVGADEIVRALCRVKGELLGVDRPELASRVDRLHGRYRHVHEILEARFEPGELAFERARSLVGQVSLGAVDDFDAMVDRAKGIRGMDADYVRRRLAKDAARLSAEETEALRRRLALLEETEIALRRLAARNEAALTALDDAAVRLSSVVTGRPKAALGAERACDELRRFIEGAERYGQRQQSRPSD